MNKLFISLTFCLGAAIFLFASNLSAAAVVQRYPTLNLAPIPAQSDSVLADRINKLDRCSARVSESNNSSIIPLLDGTGIFQDFKLGSITEVQPSFREPVAQLHPSAENADQKDCAYSAFLTTS